MIAQSNNSIWKIYPAIYINGEIISLTEGYSPAGSAESDQGIDLFIGNDDDFDEIDE